MPRPRHSGLFALITLILCCTRSNAQTPAEQQLLALANADRAHYHLAPLTWDPALAAAARAHAIRILREPGSDRDLDHLQHQYPGEPDLLARASTAGAHFSTVSENLAVANTSLVSIEDGWMHSPTHRHNLLNPALDRIGISILSSHGFLYAVQDFSTAVPARSLLEVERSVAHALLDHGLTLVSLSDTARLACRNPSQTPEDPVRGTPLSVIQWDSPEPATLPPEVLQAIAGVHSRTALLGACPGQQGSFSTSHVAVLLF